MKKNNDNFLGEPRKKKPEIRCNFRGCNGIHEPNEETKKVFREIDAGINLESYDSLEDFWKAMGVNPNPKSKNS